MVREIKNGSSKKSISEMASTEYGAPWFYHVPYFIFLSEMPT